MKARLLAALLAAALAGGCHLWGSGRSVELPEPAEQVTATGVRWLDLREGLGREAGPRSRITVHYVARVEDGPAFDSSYDRGTPLSCTLGAGEVIPGWDDGLAGMREGGRRRLVVPPARAYGDEGVAGVIPPRATLVFEIELLKVE